MILFLAGNFQIFVVSLRKKLPDQCTLYSKVHMPYFLATHSSHLTAVLSAALQALTLGQTGPCTICYIMNSKIDTAALAHLFIKSFKICAPH